LPDVRTMHVAPPASRARRAAPLELRRVDLLEHAQYNRREHQDGSNFHFVPQFAPQMARRE
jgi:hypothetical protein